MELKGTIIGMLPMVEGTGKNGVWTKQEYILEIPGQYSKKVCFSLWGAKIDEYMLKPNDIITVSIDIESREYQSRWYTEVKGYKVVKGQSQKDEDITISEPVGTNAGNVGTSDPDDDILPF